MADIINLRQARKSKKRSAKADQASDNRIKFGRTKLEKLRSNVEKSKYNSNLDGKKLDGN